MEVSLYAVKVTINEYLALPLDSDDIQYIADRLVKLQLCQNAINSILTLEKSTTELAREIRYEFESVLFIVVSLYRHSWQGVRAIQLFVEHVIGKHESMFVDLLPFAKRIKLVRLTPYKIYILTYSSICHQKPIQRYCELTLLKHQPLKKYTQLSIH